MLIASWFLVSFLKRFRSFIAENLSSIGWWGAKLPAIKLWEWFDPGPTQIRADQFNCDFSQGVILKLNWQNFGFSWPPTYPQLTLLLNRLIKERWHLSNHLPTSFCQCSFRTTPNIFTMIVMSLLYQLCFLEKLVYFVNCVILWEFKKKFVKSSWCQTPHLIVFIWLSHCHYKVPIPA